jgi:diguanylate cyclase (GGDEF)-like protein
MVKTRDEPPTALETSVAPARPGRDATTTYSRAGTAARQHLDGLLASSRDLVDGDDLEVVLARLAGRAAAALSASGYVLHTLGPAGPTVRSAGLDADGAAQVVADVRGCAAGDGSLVVVPIGSARGVQGWFALTGRPEPTLSGQQGALLQAYACHLAVTLDLSEAPSPDAPDEGTGDALIDLAHRLSRAREPSTVARVVCEALAGIIGCDRAAMMLWDPLSGTLRAVATSGYADDARDFLMGTPIATDEAPEMTNLLAHHEPLFLEVATASPEVAALLERTGGRSAIVMPLLAGDVLMGVVSAGWTEDLARAGLRAYAVRRLMGICDQASTALENARLLATIRHQSEHDVLTGLPNRAVFARALDDALRLAGAVSATAVLFCDLDKFKQVNDRYGHVAGDELLRQAGARIRAELRPSDVVGRLGGDEFGILLSSVGDDRQPVRVAERLVEHLDEPFRIGGHEIRITAAVGVAVHPGPDGRGERLLAAADSAMSIAKQRGPSQVVVAGAMLARRVVPSLEAELGAAVLSDQLRLFFQPVVDVSDHSTGSVVGAEALLRWAHPRLGLLNPGAFLPLAEETGLISDLDLWALGAACEELAGWPSDGPVLHVAVNLSSGTLVDPRLIPCVRAALTRWGLDPHRLHLEVVESRSLIDLPAVIDRLVELRQMGVRISLDDFGTGYSTLSWLQALPIDQIKIDRSFIMRLPGHAESLAVVRGVLALARELGIEVIAEGVEDRAQLAMLRAAGCDLVQGYLLGRPAPMLDLSAPAAAAT